MDQIAISIGWYFTSAFFVGFTGVIALTRKIEAVDGGEHLSLWGWEIAIITVLEKNFKKMALEAVIGITLSIGVSAFTRWGWILSAASGGWMGRWLPMLMVAWGTELVKKLTRWIYVDPLAGIGGIARQIVVDGKAEPQYPIISLYLTKEQLPNATSVGERVRKWKRVEGLYECEARPENMSLIDDLNLWERIISPQNRAAIDKFAEALGRKVVDTDGEWRQPPAGIFELGQKSGNELEPVDDANWGNSIEEPVRESGGEDAATTTNVVAVSSNEEELFSGQDKPKKRGRPKKDLQVNANEKGEIEVVPEEKKAVVDENGARSAP